MVLLQIRSTPIRIPSTSKLLFNRSARGILPKFNTQLVLHDNDGSSHIALFREAAPGKPRHTHKNIPFLPTGSTVAVWRDDGGPWMHGKIVGHGKFGVQW